MSITIHGEDHRVIETLTGDHSRDGVKDLVHRYAGAYAWVVSPLYGYMVSGKGR